MAPGILAVFAHPDDESSCSGTLAMAAARGWRVALACATRGEAGEIADPSLATPETLGEVREAELRAACKTLGIEQVHFLGYCDSGMAGTPQNKAATSFVRADPGTVTRQIVALIRKLRPEIVVTFEPFGIYGHPDHIAVSRYTSAAYDHAGDASVYPESGSPWSPDRLYYTAFPSSWFERVRARLAALRINTGEFEQMGKQIQGNTKKVDSQITHELVVSDYLKAKIDALACHRTQLNPQAPFYHMLRPEMAQVMAYEYFIQVRGAESTGGDFFP